MTPPPNEAPPVHSAPALLEEAVALNGLVMFVNSGAPGMVLVVVRGPDMIIKGYGETTKGNGHEPDGKSLLRLGSVTKVFTGEVLAALVNSGKVRLTDPLTLLRRARRFRALANARSRSWISPRTRPVCPVMPLMTRKGLI